MNSWTMTTSDNSWTLATIDDSRTSATPMEITIERKGNQWNNVIVHGATQALPKQDKSPKTTDR